MEKKPRLDTDTATENIKSHANNALKTLQYEKESRAIDCASCDDRVAKLRKEVNMSLYQTF